MRLAFAPFISCMLLICLVGCQSVLPIALSEPTVLPVDTETPAPTVTPTHLPTDTIEPTTVPDPSSTPTATKKPTRTPKPTLDTSIKGTPLADVVLDIRSFVQSANILVFEDVAGMVGILDRRVQLVVEYTMDKTNIVYVADRQGDFLRHLNSDTQWDLIVVAAESRDGIRGEFWDVIYDHVVNRKASLIMEVWYLDEIHTGRIAPLLEACGVRYESDWLRSSLTAIDDIKLYDRNDRIFSLPFQINSPIKANFFWTDDVGDFISKIPGSDAKILAGGDTTKKSPGVLATCLEGRMTIQTFSTHDYDTEEMVYLWANYLNNAMTSRYIALRY